MVYHLASPAWQLVETANLLASELRITLIILAVVAMGGSWLVEQPRSSMLPWHPRVRLLWRLLPQVWASREKMVVVTYRWIENKIRIYIGYSTLGKHKNHGLICWMIHFRAYNQFPLLGYMGFTKARLNQVSLIPWRSSKQPGMPECTVLAQKNPSGLV